MEQTRCTIIGFNEVLGHDSKLNEEIKKHTRTSFINTPMFQEAVAIAAGNLGTNADVFLTKRQAGKFMSNSGTVYEEYVKDKACKY